jgi:hypothetical protein
MATETVPAQASGGKVVEAWWFGLLVRSALALLGLWTLSFAADRYDSFLVDYQRQLRMNNWLWLSWASAMVAAGFLFGLATWLPFAKVRFLPSRLLLAALALLPLAHFRWVYIQGHGSGGWLARGYWFDGAQIQFVLPALAGVAIASGFRAKGIRVASTSR